MATVRIQDVKVFTTLFKVIVKVVNGKELNSWLVIWPYYLSKPIYYDYFQRNLVKLKALFPALFNLSNAIKEFIRSKQELPPADNGTGIEDTFIPLDYIMSQ